LKGVLKKETVRDFHFLAKAAKSSSLLKAEENYDHTPLLKLSVGKGGGGENCGSDD
jgi:hypothetical protein